MSKKRAKYFRNKFNSIPDEEWCTGEWTNCAGQHCAMGHLGATGEDGEDAETEESKELRELFKANHLSSPEEVNDGTCFTEISTTTPKERILKALDQIIAQEEVPEHVDITKELAVLPVDETADTYGKEEEKTLALQQTEC